MRSVLVLLLSTSVCLAHGEAGGSDRPCGTARVDNVWCAEKQLGYVAAVAIRSQLLFEALDVYGHHFEAAAIDCPICRDAFRNDGFCATHRIGFVRGKGYLTPLTFHLARGRRIDPDALGCPICREHTRGIGWCERDDVGIAGLTAIDDRGDFEELRRAYDLLLSAVALSARCEMCAAAMVADGYCPVHRAGYRRGERVPER